MAALTHLYDVIIELMGKQLSLCLLLLLLCLFHPQDGSRVQRTEAGVQVLQSEACPLLGVTHTRMHTHAQTHTMSVKAWQLCLLSGGLSYHLADGHADIPFEGPSCLEKLLDLLLFFLICFFVFGSTRNSFTALQ